MLSETPVWAILPRLMQRKSRIEQKHFARRTRRQDGHESFRIVTYNVHRCRGLDRRILPRRIVEVLRELDPDVVALQEVLSESSAKREDDQPRYIAEELGLDYTFGEVRQMNGSGYGNAILSHLPVTLTENFNLSHKGREEGAVSEPIWPFRRRPHSTYTMSTLGQPIMSGAIKGGDLSNQTCLPGKT